MVQISDEILKTIQTVISIQSPKYHIAGYDKEDIEQEAFIMCMEALKHWDQERPLENFLAVHLSYRLKSLVRDKHKLQGRFAETAKKILRAVDINSVNWDTERSLIGKDDVNENVVLNDIEETINKYLPISLRRDYLQMKAGVRINKGRIKKIRDFIEALLEEFN